MGEVGFRKEIASTSPGGSRPTSPVEAQLGRSWGCGRRCGRGWGGRGWVGGNLAAGPIPGMGSPLTRIQAIPGGVTDRRGVLRTPPCGRIRSPVPLRGGALVV